MKKDNTTFRLKFRLRRKLLSEFDMEPVVLETHGGMGALYQSLYYAVDRGVVIEKDHERAAYLAKQRPTWACYAGDCVPYVRAGLGDWLDINYLDIDPYGSPWPVISAFFESDRLFPERMAIAVNDGLRLRIKRKGAWDVFEMRSMVEKYGAGRMYKDYLLICQELLSEKAAQRGYKITRWAGYYCGGAKSLTHYAAILERTPGVAVLVESEVIRDAA